MKITSHHFRWVLQGFKQTLATVNVPNFDCVVPGTTGKFWTAFSHRCWRTEANWWDWCCMAAQDFKQLACFETPEVDIVGLNWTCCYNIPTARFNCKATKLGRLRGSHRSEITILDEIKRSDSAIKTRCNYSISFLWCELHSCDFGSMLSEGDEAQTVFRRPEFYLSIVTSRCHIAAIRAISEWVKIKEMALLLQNISLALPLPNKQLPLLLWSKSNPIPL